MPKIFHKLNIASYTTTNGDYSLNYPTLLKGSHRYRIPIPFDLFTPGSYELTIAWIVPNREVLFRFSDSIRIEVENSNYPGHILLDGRKETFSKPVKWEEF